MPPSEVLVIVAVVVLAVAAHFLVQRRFDTKLLSRHNDVAGFLLSVVGVIYAVVLGFVVIVAWQKYDAAKLDVDTEAAAAVDLDHAITGFPAPLRDEVRGQLLAYARVVLKAEWPAMARGTVTFLGSPDLERIATEVETYRPADAAQADTHQLALSDVQTLFDARRRRIIQNEPSVPAILWSALVAGAVATLGFAYLFGVENRIAQLVMTGIVAGLIAIMFVVIAAFDQPFRGVVAIAPSGWQYFLERAAAIDPTHPPSNELPHGR